MDELKLKYQKFQEKIIQENEFWSVDLLLSDFFRIIDNKLVVPPKTLKNHLFYFLNSIKSQIIFKFSHFIFGTKKVDVLFHITQESHLKQFIPVYNELNKIGIKSGFITTNLSLFKSILERKLPIPFIKILNINKRDLFINNLIPKEIEVELNQILNKKIINYLKANKLLNGWKINFYKNSIIGINNLFIGNDLTFDGRLICRLGKKNNLKTYTIQHGFLANDFIQCFHIVDYFYLYGLKSLKSFNKLNRLNTIPIITGAPYLDPYFINKINTNHFSFSTDFLMTNSLKDEDYILICFSGHGHLTSKSNYYKSLNILFKFIKLNSQLRFIAKLHPKEKIYDYQINGLFELENLRIFSHEMIPSRDKDIFKWIFNSKLLITGNSSTIFEAILFDKPIISIDVENEYDFSDKCESEVIKKVKSYKEFEKLISEYLINPKKDSKKRFDLANEYFSDFNKGISSLNVINELIKNNDWA